MTTERMKKSGLQSHAIEKLTMTLVDKLGENDSARNASSIHHGASASYFTRRSHGKDSLSKES
ncbi:MAG: hypothetical protein ACLTGI_09285 [Hoylesella buccalis]